MTKYIYSKNLYNFKSKSPFGGTNGKTYEYIMAHMNIYGRGDEILLDLCSVLSVEYQLLIQVYPQFTASSKQLIIIRISESFRGQTFRQRIRLAATAEESRSRQ